MKELDLLLLGYLNEHWAGAAPDEKTAFEVFLQLPDPVIARYLLGGEDPPDAVTRGLVLALRAASVRPVSPAGARPA